MSRHLWLLLAITLMLSCRCSWRPSPRLSFAGRVDYRTGMGPVSVMAGDLDSDGDMDLVAANRSDDDVTVMLNDGTGAFSQTQDFFVGARAPDETGNGLSSIGLADIDLDGDLDVAVGSISLGGLALLLNNGDGTLVPPIFLGAGLKRISPVFADLESDGDPDLVVLNLDLETATVFLNDDGSFTDQFDLELGGQGSEIIARDIDGDGDVDLIAATWRGANIAAVLLNNGDATFAPAVNYCTLSDAFWGGLGDFDLDGDLDFAVGGFDGVVVLLNDGAGRFGPPSVFSTYAFVDGEVADIDGDGISDVVVVMGFDRIGILFGDGLGGLIVPALELENGGDGHIAVTDLDNDGDTDITVPNGLSDIVSVSLNLGGS